MSREIKFRSWNGNTRKMTTPFVWVNECNLISTQMVSTPTAPLMQYTGLNDKNGVEIYEGDIVSGVIYSDHSIHDGLILFDYNGYRINTKTKSLPLDLTDKLKVIGNIHQNPELLDDITK